MSTKLLAKALNVSSEVRKFIEQGHDDVFHWRKVVLNVIENVASQAEVSDCQLITCNKFLIFVLSQALFADIEKFGADTIFDGTHSCGFLISRGEQRSLHSGIEEVRVSLHNHVNKDSLFPVASIVVTVNLTKRTKQSRSLLTSLPTEVYDR